MRRENINYLVVGTFVIVMGVLFLAVVYKITGRSGATDDYHVYYSNVAGIKYGTGVHFEGYLLGQVEEIVPESSDGGLRYRVNLTVARGWEIPNDSIAKVVSSGFLSAVTIDISQGTSASMLAPGAELQGQDQFNMFAAIADMAAQFRSLSDDGIKPVLLNLNEHFTRLANEYTDLSSSTIRPFVESLQRGFGDKEVMDKLRSFIVRIEDSAGRVQRLLGDSNQEHMSSILENLDGASANLGGLVVRIEETRGQLDQVLDNVDTLIDDNDENVNEAMADLRKSLREIADHIDAVMHDIEGGSRNINEFTRHIRENPGALLRGTAPSDKGGAQ